MTSSFRDDAIQCRSCKQAVSGYEHRTIFVFNAGERLRLGNCAVLSCGCEVPEYDLIVDKATPGHPTTLVDVLRRVVVLEFNDAGKHNSNWHGSGEE